MLPIQSPWLIGGDGWLTTLDRPVWITSSLEREPQFGVGPRMYSATGGQITKSTDGCGDEVRPWRKPPRQKGFGSQAMAFRMFYVASINIGS